MYYICNPQFESFDSWNTMAVQLRGICFSRVHRPVKAISLKRGAGPLIIRMFFKVVSERMSDHANMSDPAIMNDRAMSDHGNADHSSMSDHLFFNPLLN